MGKRGSSLGLKLLCLGIWLFCGVMGAPGDEKNPAYGAAKPGYGDAKGGYGDGKASYKGTYTFRLLHDTGN